jgi:hypothetical protein
MIMIVLLAAVPAAAQFEYQSDVERGYIETFDTATSELLWSNTPVWFVDDFLGNDVNATVSTTGDGVWATVQTNLNTAIDTLDDQDNGVVQLALDSDNNAERAVLYWGDVRGVPIDNGSVFEARVRVSTIPTTASTTIIIGLAGDDNATPDSITEGAWFRLDGGSGAIKVETDDTTTNNDDVATGVTAATPTWHILRIDTRKGLDDVRFFIDGDRVASGTTFDADQLTASEVRMQPYVAVNKSDGTGVGTLLVDYIKLLGDRE